MAALETGGDFAKYLWKKTKRNNISLVNGKWDAPYQELILGVGIRIIHGLNAV